MKNNNSNKKVSFFVREKKHLFSLGCVLIVIATLLLVAVVPLSIDDNTFKDHGTQVIADYDKASNTATYTTPEGEKITLDTTATMVSEEEPGKVYAYYLNDYSDMRVLVNSALYIAGYIFFGILMLSGTFVLYKVKTAK